MPSFRSEKKEFVYQKNKTAPLKNKKSFLNFRRQHEWNDDSESEKSKWIKINHKTDSPNCMPDIIRELEKIVSKYGHRDISLKAINPLFFEGCLTFYLKVVKNDSNTLCRNYHYIDRYNLKCSEYNDINMPTVFPEDWNNVVKQTLEKRVSHNEATGETEVNLSNFANDAYLSHQGLMLRMSNAHVMQNVFNLFKKTNLKTIHRLNLSDNEISNVYQLKMFLEHCEVLRVDLSNNRLKRMEDLKIFSTNSVTELNVTNNDFEKKMKPKHLQEEVKKLLPALTILNGKTLPASIIIAGETSAPKKVLPTTVLSDKSTDVYTQFVQKYCASFDSVTRDGLCDFYDTESVMSLACSTSEMPHCYRSHNSNIRMTKHNDSPSDNYKRGKASIVGTLAAFPKTKHIEETLNVDVAFRTSSHMMFTLSGVYLELPERGSKTAYRPRPFSRTMVILNGSILQDHITLFASDSHLYNKFKSFIDITKEQNEFPEKYREELKNFSPEAVEIVRKFKTFTGMTVAACLEFLSSINNLSDAMEKFTEMKGQGQIPKEAYERR